MRQAQEIVSEDLERIAGDLDSAAEKLSGKTILITGPAGLLASYLVDTVAYLNDRKILAKPAKVIGLTKDPIAADSRLGHLLGRPDVIFYTHDVRQPFEPKERIDFIIHAAGNSAPAFFQADPLGTIDVNVQGLRWLLEFAKEKRVEGLLYFSSGEIYGNPPADAIPTPETFNGNISPLAPRACYTEAKRLGETLCQVYWEKFQVPTRIVRPFIVYGPGILLQDRRVMMDFIRSGLEGRPITMLSPGLDTRSYCYVSDATPIFWKILLSDRNAEPFNVGGDREEVSIKQLAEMVHKIFNITVPVGAGPEDDPKFLQGAPQRVKPDVTKIRQLFEFEQKVLLEEGLRRLINWNLLLLNRPVLSEYEKSI